MRNRIGRTALGMALAAALLAGPGAWAAMEFVNVPAPGGVANLADASTGSIYGSVGYNYNIGKYEVTFTQYTEFLNAVGKTDTYSLYNTSMGTDLNIRGIARSGVSGNYAYSVIGSGLHPVAYVSWEDTGHLLGDRIGRSWCISGGTSAKPCAREQRVIVVARRRLLHRTGNR